MKTRKELKKELEEKREQLKIIEAKDNELNAGVYRSRGNVCPTANGLKTALKRRDLELEIKLLEETTTLSGYLKYKKQQKQEQEIQTTRAKTLTKTKK